MKYALTLLALLVFTGCRDSAEFFGFTGRPEGSSGWAHDYEATPHDTWEAFRTVALQNGRIDREDPEKMELHGLYLPHDSSQKYGERMRGRVIDKSEDGKLRSRLIVHAWDELSAHGGERQDIAQSYCNAVYRVLKQRQGTPQTPDTRVDTTSEAPVQADEAVGYFKATREQAFEAARAAVAQFGEVKQAQPEQGFIRGVRKIALETTEDDVRVSVYDRTEGDSPRVKVSVRVRRGDQPLQQVAQAYVAEIRKALEAQLPPEQPD